ncbi:hypothetical protein HGG75_15675 [Ochrobactrum pseudogrignonense]|nr:hypothetical protein [Brucella pseudogrignonensis]
MARAGSDEIDEAKAPSAAAFAAIPAAAPKSVVARDCEASAGYYLMTWIPPLFECRHRLKSTWIFAKHDASNQKSEASNPCYADGLLLLLRPKITNLIIADDPTENIPAIRAKASTNRRRLYLKGDFFGGI